MAYARLPDTGAVISLRSMCASICWTRNRRRSAAVSRPGRRTSAPPVFATSPPRCAARSQLNSQLFPVPATCGNAASQSRRSRLKKARSGLRVRPARPPQARQTSSAGKTARQPHDPQAEIRHRAPQICGALPQCSSTVSSRRKNFSFGSAGGQKLLGNLGEKIQRHADR